MIIKNENDPEIEENNYDESSENDILKQNIEDLGIPNIATGPKDIQFISIIGEVEGHVSAPPPRKATKYEHILPLLIAAEQDESIKGIFIILNTLGGDVEAGLALSEMINSLSKPSVSLVLGGGHSIGAPLATCSNYSFIAPRC